MLWIRLSMLLAGLLCLAGGTAAGQSSVRGTMWDSGTGEGVPSALVQLLDERGRARASALTDEAGRYVLLVPSRGGYWLRVERLGYQPTETRPFVVGRSESRVLDLALVPEAVALEGITVTTSRRQLRNYTGFLERQRWGWGKYLGPEDIERRRASRVSQLLMGLPGLTIMGSGTVRVTGRGANCPPTIYVDGLRFAPEGADMPVDVLVPGSQVRAVEVYRSSMLAPPELQLSTGGCGVIILWTDYGLGV